MSTAIIHYIIVGVSAAVAILAYLPYGWSHTASGAIAAGLAVVVGSATATVQVQSKSSKNVK